MLQVPLEINWIAMAIQLLISFISWTIVLFVFFTIIEFIGGLFISAYRKLRGNG